MRDFHPVGEQCLVVRSANQASEMIRFEKRHPLDRVLFVRLLPNVYRVYCVSREFLQAAPRADGRALLVFPWEKVQLTEKDMQQIIQHNDIYRLHNRPNDPLYSLTIIEEEKREETKEECKLVDRVESSEQARESVHMSLDPQHMLVMVYREPAKYDVYCVHVGVIQHKLQMDYSMWPEFKTPNTPMIISLPRSDVQQFNRYRKVVLHPREPEEFRVIGNTSTKVYMVHRLLSITNASSRLMDLLKTAYENAQQLEMYSFEEAEEIRKLLMGNLWNAFRGQIPRTTCMDVSLWMNPSGHCYVHAAFAVFFLPHLEDLESENMSFWQRIFLELSPVFDDPLKQTSQHLMLFFRIQLELMFVVSRMFLPSMQEACLNLLSSWNRWAEVLGILSETEIHSLTSRILKQEFSKVVSDSLDHLPIIAEGGSHLLMILALLKTFFPPPLAPYFFSEKPMFFSTWVNIDTLVWTEEERRWVWYYEQLELRVQQLGRMTTEIVHLLRNMEHSMYAPLPPLQIPMGPVKVYYGTGASLLEVRSGVTPLKRLPRYIYSRPNIIGVVVNISLYNELLHRSIPHSLTLLKCKNEWYVYCDICKDVLYPARRFLMEMLHIPLSEEEHTETLEQILLYSEMYMDVQTLHFRT